MSKPKLTANSCLFMFFAILLLGLFLIFFLIRVGINSGISPDTYCISLSTNQVAKIENSDKFTAHFMPNKICTNGEVIELRLNSAFMVDKWNVIQFTYKQHIITESGVPYDFVLKKKYSLSDSEEFREEILIYYDGIVQNYIQQFHDRIGYEMRGKIRDYNHTFDQIDHLAENVYQSQLLEAEYVNYLRD